MRPRTFQRFALAATLLLVAPLAAVAQHHGGAHSGHRHGGPGGLGPDPRGHGPHGPGPGFLLAQLDLAADQEEAIHEILESHRDDGAELREGLESARRALREAARPEALDESAVQAAAVQIGTFEAELAIQRARVMQEVRQVLTPEQIERADELRERGLEMRERGSEHFQERREFRRERRREGDSDSN